MVIAQAPHRRHRPAARKENVAANASLSVRTGKEVKINAVGHRNLDHHRTRLAQAALPIGLEPNGLAVLGDGIGLQCLDAGMRAAIERRIADRIHKHSVTARRNIKRHRGMGVARIGHGIGIDADRLLASGLPVRLQLQAKAIDILIAIHRKRRDAPARGSFEGDRIGSKWRVLASPHRRHRIDEGGSISERDRRNRFGQTQAQAPQAGCNTL